jgi:hypothetical protein
MFIPTPDYWIIRIPVDVLMIFAFVLVLLPSLWKLTISRPGLILVFSRVSKKKIILSIEAKSFLEDRVGRVLGVPKNA